mgnify:CR=1 FL=1
MLGLNNVVVFSPEEEETTKGPAGDRRKYFNRIFSICSPKYLENLLIYNKILKYLPMKISLYEYCKLLRFNIIPNSQYNKN